MLTMRGHNEGSFYRLKSGQWVAQVTMRDGRRASRWAKDRDEAKAELAELLRLRDAGAPLTGRVRLGSYLEAWVTDDHGWAPSTWRKHQSAVRVHLAGGPLGHLRLSELSSSDIDRWLGGRELQRLHPQTRRHLRSTLRRALADAHRQGLVARNVGTLSHAPSLAHTERTILDAAQARLLIESTRTTRYGPLWTILVTTGLRISEALGLMWSSVDFGGNDEAVRTDPGRGPRGDVARGSGASGYSPPLRGRTGHRDNERRGPSLTVRHQLARENGEWVRRPPKTAKGRRTIPLTALGVEALRAQRDQQTADLGKQPRPIDGLVFTSSTGHPLHETNTLKALGADLAAAGLPRVTQHDLRHSCATLLYSMGVPLETIADILGHSSVRVTQDLYRHRVADLQRDAADRMQAMLG